MIEEDTFQHPGKMDDRKKEYSPGSVKLDEALSRVDKAVMDAETRMIRERRGEVKVSMDLKDLVLMELKRCGFDHFVALSCIDWPEKKKFDLVYHLWSYGTNGLIMVKTEVPRDDPTIGSIVEIFRASITYEREIHEMFGVDFPGNPRLTAFILEDWDGPPPMRKDFDSISYSQETYDMKVRYEKALPPGLGKRGDDK